MSLEDLKNRIFNKGKSEEDKVVHTLYIVMREFGYTIEELGNLPLPTLKFIVKEKDKENKEMNKKGRNR